MKQIPLPLIYDLPECNRVDRWHNEKRLVSTILIQTIAPEPRFFETMVFEIEDGEVNWLEIACQRTDNIDDAVWWHCKMVLDVLNGNI